MKPALEHRFYGVRPGSDTDTANVQIRLLTQGLGIYSMKQQRMNTED